MALNCKAPGFDDDLGFGARAEPPDVQVFVAELAWKRSM